MRISRYNNPIRARRAGAFTIVELLVVVGIIVALAALFLPMLVKALRQANRTRLLADLNTVGLALEAYKGDFGDYPRLAPPDIAEYRGAHLLAKALLSPAPATGVGGDGANGPGFRARPSPGLDRQLGTDDDTGTVTPPYLQADIFAIAFLDGTPVSGTDPKPWDQVVMLDKNKSPILYYPASPASLNVSVGTAYVNRALWNVSPQPRYNSLDNERSSWISLTELRWMLGDTDNNGIMELSRGETTPVTLPYLLWSAGADGIFCTDLDVSTMTMAERDEVMKRVDDVTNFR